MTRREVDCDKLLKIAPGDLVKYVCDNETDFVLLICADDLIATRWSRPLVRGDVFMFLGLHETYGSLTKILYEVQIYYIHTYDLIENRFTRV